jgi:hypothetical protein
LSFEKKWLEFISQYKKNNAFAIFNQFIVSLSDPALHIVSQLHFLGAKTDPRENPEKYPERTHAPL